MQSTTVKQQFWNYVKAKTEEKKGRPKTGRFLVQPAALVKRSTIANSESIQSAGEQPIEVLHLLIDYRAGNEVLAKKIMDRRKAFNLNFRLRSTGLAWAVKTGH